MTTAPRYGDWDLLGRMFREARPYVGRLALLFAWSVLGAPLALMLPLPVKVVVDHVLGSVPLPPLLVALLPQGAQGSPAALLVLSAVAVAVLAVLVQAQSMAAWLLETWIGQRLVLDLRARLFAHLQRLSLAFHAVRGTSDSLYRLQFDATSIQSVAVGGAIPFATAIVKVVVLVVATARLDWVLAVVALLGGPLLFGLTELYRRRLRRRWAEVREHESAALSVVQESLHGLRVVQAFGQESRETARYLERAGAGVRAAMRAVLAHGTFDLLVGLTNGLAAAAILYLGARHVQDGVITLGELVLILAYLSQLFLPLREIGTRVAAMQQALASAARVFAVLDERPDVTERPLARALPRARGAFTFVDVAFAYPGGRPVLAGVDLQVPAGARVGVVGRTGSGKSTLLSLLPRFYDPTGGAVLLDGVDLRDIRLADLRAQFAIVLQESLLFSTTIRENIAYGRPDAPQAAILAAARSAAADGFIEALPRGYDTMVGEGGATLSGGERQRIALARAFLRDAPVLILDEPTSALDQGTEAEVLEALERLMQGRTTFMIAHRVHTLAACDLRLQVGDGRVTVVEDLGAVGLDET